MGSAASSPGLVATPGKRGSISPGRQTTEGGGAAYKKLKVGSFFRQSKLGFAPAVEQGIGRSETPDIDAEIAIEEQMQLDAAEHGWSEELVEHAIEEQVEEDKK